MNSLVEENYLKALFNNANEQGEVNVKELAQILGLKMPTVTSMMKKLATKKLVHYESYKPLKLTTKGKREAGKIIRKHRLTEMFLVDKMGFGWENVHEIAEQIEHIKSPEFFQRMDELLDHPKLDPHGSPIPDKDGKMDWIQYDKLCDCKEGDKVRLAAVVNTSAEFLTYLNKRNLKLDSIIDVLSVEEFDKTMQVQYDESPETSLSLAVSERILVEHIKVN